VGKPFQQEGLKKQQLGREKGKEIRSHGCRKGERGIKNLRHCKGGDPSREGGYNLPGTSVKRETTGSYRALSKRLKEGHLRKNQKGEDSTIGIWEGKAKYQRQTRQKNVAGLKKGDSYLCRETGLGEQSLEKGKSKVHLKGSISSKEERGKMNTKKRLSHMTQTKISRKVRHVGYCPETILNSGGS